MTKEEERKNIVQGFQNPVYQESDSVRQAQAMLQQQLSQKPGAYQSQWQQQLSDTMDKILNREKFQYDLNGDALYQQYKDRYVTQGKMAMMDTMGQAQAMTGGYGNSYAQNVGQQAYQSHLQALNDRIPELYNLALSQYQLEGDQLSQRLGLLQQQESQDYGRYQDSQNAWLAERDYLAGRYDAERNSDYNRFANDRDLSYSQYVNDRNYAWQQEQAAQEQARWQAEFDEAKRQYDQNYTLQQLATAAKRAGGGGGYKVVRENPPDDENDDDNKDSGNSMYADIVALASGGASFVEIDRAIAYATVDGAITASQAAELEKKYVPAVYR